MKYEGRDGHEVILNHRVILNSIQDPSFALIAVVSNHGSKTVYHKGRRGIAQKEEAVVERGRTHHRVILNLIQDPSFAQIAVNTRTGAM